MVSYCEVYRNTNLWDIETRHENRHATSQLCGVLSFRGVGCLLDLATLEHHWWHVEVRNHRHNHP